MRARFAQYTVVFAIASAVACSTTEIAPPPPPAPPVYLSVPHPAGQDTQDVVAIFRDKSAPQMDTLRECDADFRKLTALTNALEEVRSGTRELVAADPVKYHWCFYSKLLELNGFLKSDTTFVDERQKRALETYNFLVPVARGFLAEYQDSRYLRFSVTHYRRLSEWIFFRKLELTPQATSELVDAANPFGLYRTPADTSSILDKYALAPAPSGQVAPSGMVQGGPVLEVIPVAETAPALETAAAAEASPVVAASPAPAAEEAARAPAAEASPAPVPSPPAVEPAPLQSPN